MIETLKETLRQLKDNRNKLDKTILYLGLNDKDTHAQKLTTENAITKLNNYLILENIEGASITLIKGIYKNEIENTLKIEIVDYSKNYNFKKSVSNLIETLLSGFNQESISVSYEKVKSELIGGFNAIQ